MADTEAATLFREFQGDPRGLDIWSLRKLVRRLQSDQRDGVKRLEILEDRLQATNNELAFRLCEADECRDELYDLQREQQYETQNRLRLSQLYALPDDEDPAEVLEKRTMQIRRCLRNALQEQITQVIGRKKRDEHGFVVHSEGDLMVQKSAREERRERNIRDTVLVTYVMPYSEQKYNLMYRVAESTTTKSLKDDACTYWGLNEAEFVLKVSNNSKVHDTMKVLACFRPNEEAHLLLVYKTPKNPSILCSEYADIVPKVGRKSLRREEQGKANGKRTEGGASTNGGLSSNKSLAEEILLIPGLYRFMTQRDRNVKKHLKTLRLRQIFAYFVLALLTAFSITLLRPPSLGHACAIGISEPLTGGVNSPVFDSIRSEEAVWEWLKESIGAQVFTDDSMLREYNYLVGYLQVLFQQVSEPSPAHCQGTEDGVGANFKCVHPEFRDSTADRSQQDQLEGHWASKIGQDGRSLEKPWEYRMSHGTSGANPFAEAYQRTDGSGYRFEYLMHYTPLTAVRNAFLSDMHFLQQVDWISNQTRAVHISFVAYNGNYQTWTWNRYTLEMSAFGTIHPLVRIDPFRPHLLEYGLDWELLVSDIVRLCMIFFLVLQGVYDFVHGKKAGVAWWRCVTIQNLADFSILAFFLVAFGFRISYYASEPSVSYATSHLESFRDAGQVAASYGIHVSLEAGLLALSLFRFFYSLRVNRAVFVVWLSLERSGAYFFRLAPMLLMVFLGFIILGMAAGNGVYECNRTSGQMVSCSMFILSGFYQPVELEPGESGRLVIIVLLLVFGRFVSNAWLSILMQEYHTARVRAGFSPDMYKWKESDWVSWILPWPVDKLWWKLRRLRPSFKLQAETD